MMKKQCNGDENECANDEAIAMLKFNNKYIADLEYKYKKGFSDGAKAVCGLILETLKDQRFDILDNSNNEIALHTINTSIKSVQDRFDKYNNNAKDSESCCRCDSGQTNADRIRNMSDEELAELITNMDFDCADYCDSFVSGCAFNCEWLTEPYKKDKEVALKWLQSEAK